MIQATPFDPVLLTAATDEPIQDRDAYCEQIFTNFVERRDRFLEVNRRLAGNPVLVNCRLCMPLTNTLFQQLCNTPAWSQVQRGSPLYTLKVAVLAFLQNRQRNLNSTLYLSDTEIEYTYQLINAPEFFLRALAPDLCHAWIEAAGVCAFRHGVIESRGTPLQIHAVWVVAADQWQGSQGLKMACTHILEPDSNSGECHLPVLTEAELWAWEFLIRESLWQDRRLPFKGPDGPFGYRPPQGWQPGERPTPTRVQGACGYRDALGGIWQWEGGRARIVSPLDGHWNIQLLDSQTRQRWMSWLEEAFQRPVRLRSEYVNVEVNGQIVDRTFDLG